MRKGWRITFILMGIFLIAGRIVAEAACPTLVQEALESVSTSCQLIGRNQACYGNLSIHATSRPNTPSFSFDSVGDIIDVMELNTLKLDALDEKQGIWGLAMMQLQADIPETLPGQAVTFLLFGDVEIENRATEGQAPMQAFYMRSGVGAASCIGAPESGVLIQTPHGVKSVHFNINDVNVEIGSTVLLQAQAEGSLNIQTLEGAAVVTMEGHSYPVIAGTQMDVPLDADLHPAGLPSLVNPMTDINFNALPLNSLPRQIVPTAPLSKPAMSTLQTRLGSGLEPCGVPGLPACEHSLDHATEHVWAVQPTPEPVIEPAEPTALPIESNPSVFTPVPTLAEPTAQGPDTTAPIIEATPTPVDQTLPVDPSAPITDPVIPIIDPIVDTVLPVVDPIVDPVLPIVDEVLPVTDLLPVLGDREPASTPSAPSETPVSSSESSNDNVTSPTEAPSSNEHEHDDNRDHDKEKKDKDKDKGDNE